jgi:hypothetical protein
MVRGNHDENKSCHRGYDMINDHVIRGPNVIRFDRYTYLGKVSGVAWPKGYRRLVLRANYDHVIVMSMIMTFRPMP